MDKTRNLFSLKSDSIRGVKVGICFETKTGAQAYDVLYDIKVG